MDKVAIGGDAISIELNLYLVLLLLQLAWDETFSFGSASYSGCLVMPDPKLPDRGGFCPETKILSTDRK